MLYEKLNHMTIYGWMDGLMDIALSFLCTTAHPKRFTIQAGDLSSTTTSVQHPLGEDNYWRWVLSENM